MQAAGSEQELPTWPKLVKHTWSYQRKQILWNTWRKKVKVYSKQLRYRKWKYGLCSEQTKQKTRSVPATGRDSHSWQQQQGWFRKGEFFGMFEFCWWVDESMSLSSSKTVSCKTILKEASLYVFQARYNFNITDISWNVVTIAAKCVSPYQHRKGYRTNMRAVFLR